MGNGVRVGGGQQEQCSDRKWDTDSMGWWGAGWEQYGVLGMGVRTDREQ